MDTLYVLAVEPRASQVELLRQMLKGRAGNPVLLFDARGPDGARALLQQEHFDLVLFSLDTGAEMVSLSRLIRDFPSVPVVAIVPGDREGALTRENGAEDYVVKDRLSPDLLMRTIRYVRERKQLANEYADCTERLVRLKQEVMRTDQHDFVTGLPNRQLFLDRVEVERDRAQRQKKKLAVLRLQLEGIAPGGDAVLKESAARLKALLRKSDTIARTGEDEFALILPDVVRPDDTAHRARSILTDLLRPFAAAERTITVSIGIGIYPDDSQDLNMLFTRAGQALTRVRELGGNGFQFFSETVNRKAILRMKLEDLLRLSIDSGQLVIYYQPLVDISTRRIVCAEALARWRHPEKGLVSPNDFIPAAEEAGLIGAIDEWVLRNVLSQARSWLAAGLQPVCVTVNLSSRQLHDPGLVETLAVMLRETGVPAGCLYLEITERTAMADVDRTIVRLKEISRLGVHISIDDFGTGYSSLDQLERLPVERLKIDKSFIRRVPLDPDNRTIVRSVTSLAHNMRMKVVAEGVETEEQLTFLRTTGCDEMQGYLFSKPIPADQFEELLAKR